ncbi:MAG: hypothetical protein MJE66_03865 [Proteobacteria bacterium]|nr:hypothetical protein [Pseudomonadota bacterium]
MTLPSRWFARGLVLALACGLLACPQDPGGGGGGGQPGGGAPPPPAAKPALGGNTAFQTHGSTDDGDDGNGAATRYQTPARQSADAQTTATSAPNTYRDVAARVQATPGPNPTRLAITLANSKATSTFAVAQAIRCRLVVSSAGSVSLTSGVGDYLVVARVRTAAGPPVQGADIQGQYAFAENNANPRQLDIKRWGQPDGVMANGGVVLRVDRSNVFLLQPGNYTLEFELTTNGKADTNAALDIQAQVDLL